MAGFKVMVVPPEGINKADRSDDYKHPSAWVSVLKGEEIGFRKQNPDVETIPSEDSTAPIFSLAIYGAMVLEKSLAQTYQR